MKITEKGGYKRICFWILLCWWVIHVGSYAAYRLASMRLAKDEELFLYSADKLDLVFIIESSIILWLCITVFYGFFFLVTKPLHKKEIEEVEKNETIKKPSPEVLCKECGKPLGQAQIDYMLGNPQYQEWFHEGFCSFSCFEKHKDT
jgi:hypothetical protein